jgi:hypothetical protein
VESASYFVYVRDVSDATGHEKSSGMYQLDTGHESASQLCTRTCMECVSDFVILRLIMLFANTDVSTIKMCLDTSILAKSIMGRRE